MLFHNSSSLPIQRQIVAAFVVVTALIGTTTTSWKRISIEAFHVAVVPSHIISITENKCLMFSSNSKYNQESFCDQNVILKRSWGSRSSSRLHQAADAWTGTSDTSASRLASGGGFGNIEQMEYKIYPDGRVEELVRGIKGNNCHKVTQSIHEQLGEVIATQPTEELYEQEVQVSQTLYNTDSTTSTGGSGDWSSSSW